MLQVLHHYCRKMISFLFVFQCLCSCKYHSFLRIKFLLPFWNDMVWLQVSTQKTFTFSKSKTPGRRQWCLFSVFIVNFEHISHSFLIFYRWIWADICLLPNSWKLESFELDQKITELSTFSWEFQDNIIISYCYKLLLRFSIVVLRL